MPTEPQGVAGAQGALGPQGASGVEILESKLGPAIIIIFYNIFYAFYLCIYFIYAYDLVFEVYLCNGYLLDYGYIHYK